MSEVAAHCQAMQLAPPSYTYQTVKDNKVCALLQIGSNVFKGSFARNEGQAAESAAGVALLQLVSVEIGLCSFVSESCCSRIFLL